MKSYDEMNTEKVSTSPAANQKPYYGDTCGVHAGTGGQAQTLGRGQNSLREQAEKQVGYHRDQLEKLGRAAAFFRENPAFEEFIQLVRLGAIQF